MSDINIKYNRYSIEMKLKIVMYAEEKGLHATEKGYGISINA